MSSINYEIKSADFLFCLPIKSWKEHVGRVHRWYLVLAVLFRDRQRKKTRKHSSKMCTDCAVTRMGSDWVATRPILDRMTDTCLWKHYLPLWSVTNRQTDGGRERQLKTRIDIETGAKLWLWYQGCKCKMDTDVFRWFSSQYMCHETFSARNTNKTLQWWHNRCSQTCIVTCKRK